MSSSQSISVSYLRKFKKRDGSCVFRDGEDVLLTDTMCVLRMSVETYNLNVAPFLGFLAPEDGQVRRNSVLETLNMETLGRTLSAAQVVTDPMGRGEVTATYSRFQYDFWVPGAEGSGMRVALFDCGKFGPMALNMEFLLGFGWTGETGKVRICEGCGEYPPILFSESLLGVRFAVSPMRVNFSNLRESLKFIFTGVSEGNSL